jgi:hypothetical protein
MKNEVSKSNNKQLWDYNPKIHNKIIKKVVGVIPEGKLYFLPEDENIGYLRKYVANLANPSSNSVDAVALTPKLSVDRRVAAHIKYVTRTTIDLPAAVFFGIVAKNILTVTHEVTHLNQFQEGKHQNHPPHDEEEAYLSEMAVFFKQYPGGSFYEYLKISEGELLAKQKKEIDLLKKKFSEITELHPSVTKQKHMFDLLQKRIATKGITPEDINKRTVLETLSLLGDTRGSKSNIE